MGKAMRNAWLLWATLMVSTAGCSGNDAGGGTRTLFVEALAETDGSSNGTFFGVIVRDGQGVEAPVISNAEVIFRGENTGEIRVPWQGLTVGRFRLGAYGINGIPWDTGWQIEVNRADDHLDAFLEAPGVTTITSPLGGTTFRKSAGGALTVHWKDAEDREAQKVFVELDEANFERALSEDPFELSISASTLVADDEETVRVERSNEVELNGGLPGSFFRAVSKHQLDFRVE